jgi:glutathione S-transferase
MKLYYSKGACSLALHIIIRELKLKCECIAVDLATKKTQSGEDFLSVNPKGAVPSLVLDDGTILTENMVIQQYLADTAKATTLLPAVRNLERYYVLSWLNFAGTDLHKNCSPLFNGKVPEEVKEQAFRPILAAKLQFLDHHFEKRTFVAAEHFTLPDAYIFTVLRWIDRLGVPMSNYPNLVKFFNAMKTRPSVAQALEEEGIQ